MNCCTALGLAPAPRLRMLARVPPCCSGRSAVRKCAGARTLVRIRGVDCARGSRARFAAMTPEQKRLLEQLRELSVEIEELQARHAAMTPRRRSRGAIWRELQARKTDRRDLVPVLARAGIDARAIAEAAHLTRRGVVKLAAR
jgi:hypothetical protein